MLSSYIPDGHNKTQTSDIKEVNYVFSRRQKNHKWIYEIVCKIQIWYKRLQKLVPDKNQV